ncbi:translesion DNA synthesis-associated protein ImuA [Thauera sinica]|uniref:Translesion DNA synthesis-associated protein ImuA n=1 Tax=Thauera sinica TaxID=2665146 RepID=A0ABW1ATM9_9RHOO|nr:translesion DNA synthesis-associated protein ImuA [Thauera sp. K11]
MSAAAALASAAGLCSTLAGSVWQASRLAHGGGPVLSSGFDALDAELPGGGWPANALIELLADHPGVGELSLLLPVLGRPASGRWFAWVSPPFLPYAPALAAAGVPLSRLLLIRPGAGGDALWAARQAVASGACVAVLAWLQRIDTAGLRRLQLAAEEAATPLFLFRPRAAVRQSSPAPLRLALSGAGGMLQVTILKRRGPPAAGPLLLPVRHLQDDAAGLPGNEAGMAAPLLSLGRMAAEREQEGMPQAIPHPAPPPLSLVR